MWRPAISARNPVVPSAPSARSPRAIALRATAVSAQRVVGCTQAPRPGSVAETSTTASPSRATTLTRRDLSARSRQPRQVLTDIILSPSETTRRSATFRELFAILHSQPGRLRTIRASMPARCDRSGPESRAAASASIRLTEPTAVSPGRDQSSSRIESGWMSIRAPVSLAARRAFWPSLPMARESW
jgi:hypothetical protein